MKSMGPLTLTQSLTVLVSVFVVGFAAYGAWSLRTLNDIKVNGPMYQYIVQGKDLIADVLPPPAYILESYLTALQLAQTRESDEQTELIAKFNRLRAAYDERHVYWRKQSLDDDLAALFLKQSHNPAEAFFRIGFDELIPAVRNHDEDAIALSLAKLKDSYLSHRHAIDQVVQSTEKRNLAAEAAARERIKTAYGWMLLVLVVCMCTGVGITAFIALRLMKSLGADPATLSAISLKIADGELDFCIAVLPDDQHSVLYQIEQMRQQLKERLALAQAKQEAELRAAKAEVEMYAAERIASMEREKKAIYLSMAHAASHILNNLLNQLQLFKLTADASRDFDRSILVLFDKVTSEASKLVSNLCNVTDLNDRAINDSVAPKDYSRLIPNDLR